MTTDVRLALVAATVLALVPITGHTEEAWRWRDGAGQLHYSNERGKAPDAAEPVRTQIRVVPRREATAARRVAGGRRPLGTRFPREVAVAGVGGCREPAYPWIIINNPHELADQVKQASLLDALGVPWRRGACR